MRPKDTDALTWKTYTQIANMKLAVEKWWPL